MTTTRRISWEEIDRFCLQLVEKIKAKGFVPDVVVAPLRGGVIPAVILAHKLGVRQMVTLAAERTESDAIDAKKHAIILTGYLEPQDITGKRVLLVDEITDTGDTMHAVHAKIQALHPKEILSVSLFIGKAENVVFTPDIFGERSDAWIIFPWEIE